MKKIKVLLCLLITFAVVSCDPNENNSASDDSFAENFGNAADRDFIGQIVDADNNPIQNVTVKIGASAVQTDVNGVFIINNASVYEKFAYIKATKAGYLDGSRSMVPTTGKNNVKIMLLPAIPLQTIHAGAASEVSIYSGTKVSFDGSFQDEDGNAYTGDVQVSMFHLTPSDENINSLMPGMLYAQRENGSQAMLETFGMLNVTLRGSGGQKLNLAEGHTAEITMRIDDSLLATAPVTIPLWHFDEQGGYWKEDGVATKVGNKYVGTVSHFSWWNCDVPYPTVSLTATVLDSDGNPLVNVRIGILADGFTYPNYGITDENGQATGFVPANTPLVLTVTDICHSIIYTANVGPFANSTILPDIIITDFQPNVVEIQGTLLKCDGTNVTNGYIFIQNEISECLAPVINGSFSLNTMACADTAEFTLQGFDFDNSQTTTPITHALEFPITNVGTLTTCNLVNEFVSYQIDNNPVVITANVVVGTQNNSISLAGTNNSNNNDTIYITGNTHTPGIYTTNTFTINFLLNYGVISSDTQNTMQFNLTQCGAIGTYLDMTFNGTFYDSNNVLHTLTGTVHGGIDY